MAITRDHYTGMVEGHTIELIRNNWVKTLKLFIDGEVVDRSTCHLPCTIILKGVIEENGRRDEVVAKSIPVKLLWMKDTIEVNGEEIPLQKLS
jgi:hypothetical protein